MLLKASKINDEIKEEIENTSRQMTMKIKHLRNLSVKVGPKV